MNDFCDKNLEVRGSITIVTLTSNSKFLAKKGQFMTEKLL